MKYKYRIIFYLNPEVKERLEYLSIEYTNKKIENNSYCVIKKYTNDLYQELS